MQHSKNGLDCIFRTLRATTRVLLTVRGVSDLAVFDPAAVMAKYEVRPERYADFATLRGDPSDDLPGVKGIGEKTARTLITQYADLDALLRNIDALAPRIGANLRAAESYLAVMRQVVPLRTDVYVILTTGKRDDARLDDLGGRYRLTGPIARLRAATGTT